MIELQLLGAQLEAQVGISNLRPTQHSSELQNANRVCMCALEQWVSEEENENNHTMLVYVCTANQITTFSCLMNKRKDAKSPD